MRIRKVFESKEKLYYESTYEYLREWLDTKVSIRLDNNEKKKINSIISSVFEQYKSPKEVEKLSSSNKVFNRDTGYIWHVYNNFRMGPPPAYSDPKRHAEDSELVRRAKIYVNKYQDDWYVVGIYNLKYLNDRNFYIVDSMEGIEEIIKRRCA